MFLIWSYVKGCQYFSKSSSGWNSIIQLLSLHLISQDFQIFLIQFCTRTMRLTELQVSVVWFLLVISQPVIPPPPQKNTFFSVIILKKLNSRKQLELHFQLQCFFSLHSQRQKELNQCNNFAN